MTDFRELLRTTTQICLRARLHWDVWWLYEGEEERPKHLPILQRYSEFVRFDAHAHLTASIISSYQLYEKKNKTRNLGVLANRAATEAAIPQENIQRAKSVLADLEPLASKLRLLRNNAFGHRSLALSYDDAFDKADLDVRPILNGGIEDLRWHN